MKDKVLAEFGFKYNTTVRTCCRNKAIMKNKIL